MDLRCTRLLSALSALLSSVNICAIGAPVHAADSPSPALEADNECLADPSGNSTSQSECSLNALQQRKKVTSIGTAPACKSIDAPENAACKEAVQWASGNGRNDPQAEEWFKDMQGITGVTFHQGNLGDFQKLYYCLGKGNTWCGAPPCTCSKAPCDQCPGDGAEPPAESAGKCGTIHDPANAACTEAVRWAVTDGKADADAAAYFQDMPSITGVNFEQGQLMDFQRLYFCSPPGGKQCGLPPCSCSRPPCGTCFGGGTPKNAKPASARRPGCTANSTAIECKPPKRPMSYKGQAWPAMSFPGKGVMHIFAIGDWGGMDGSLNPIEGRKQVVAYEWGKRAGASVFPRTRWDKMHQKLLCSHKQFVECFNTRGQPPCAEGCGYVDEIDSQPQQLVANAFKARAAKMDPQYILNVGDNFYWGGIEKNCGTPMDEISFTAHHQFDQIFERVYQGEGLSGKPWLSVLGNHDWGGRVFNNGWDQQIAYTWASDRWVMPAPYWTQYVEYPDLDFSVDYYMLDSNLYDAQDPAEDPEHNICGAKHNPPDANCSVADGPASVESCPQFFRDLWREQQVWLEQKISQSRATWRIIVTHFPCGHGQEWFHKLRHQFRLDLLVTGHRHDQELWLPTDEKNQMDLTCIVTGGGGGITSEATPDPKNTVDWYGEGQYGFFDLTISATEILVESVNWDGNVTATHTVTAR